jgi:hypothetical protein
MMIIHEVLKNRSLESVWKAYRLVSSSKRQYLKLKWFKCEVGQGKFVLYHIDEYADRFHFWYTDIDNFIKFRI